MVEVFKTNIEDNQTAERVLSCLLGKFPGCRINFDLDDCDRILRVEAEQIEVSMVIESVCKLGFDCVTL